MKAKELAEILLKHPEYDVECTITAKAFGIDAVTWAKLTRNFVAWNDEQEMFYIGR